VGFESEGLTHEEMAQVIVDNPMCEVMLKGADGFSCISQYHDVNEFGWTWGANTTIVSDSGRERRGREVFNKHSGRKILTGTQLGREPGSRWLSRSIIVMYEERFDVCLLKLICWDTATGSRYFVRLKDRWIEAGS